MTAGTAVYGTVRTVVWEDGGRKPSSYPMPNVASKLSLLQEVAVIPAKGNTFCPIIMNDL